MFPAKDTALFCDVLRRCPPSKPPNSPAAPPWKPSSGPPRARCRRHRPPPPGHQSAMRSPPMTVSSLPMCSCARPRAQLRVTLQAIADFDTAMRRVPGASRLPVVCCLARPERCLLPAASSPSANNGTLPLATAPKIRASRRSRTQCKKAWVHCASSVRRSCATRSWSGGGVHAACLLHRSIIRSNVTTASAPGGRARLGIHMDPPLSRCWQNAHRMMTPCISKRSNAATHPCFITCKFILKGIKKTLTVPLRACVRPRT